MLFHLQEHIDKTADRGKELSEIEEEVKEDSRGMKNLRKLKKI